MKSLIKNTLGSKTFTFAVPADETAAGTFATACLDGTYAVYGLDSSGGSDVPVTSAKQALVGIFDATTKEKTFVGFVCPANKNENDIKAAFLNTTIDGVKADDVSVKLTPITY